MKYYNQDCSAHGLTPVEATRPRMQDHCMAWHGCLPCSCRRY